MEVGEPPRSPESLRVSGAAAFYELTEDAGRLRRRARHKQASTTEIYVQEVAPYEFLAGLSPTTRNLVFAVASHFDHVLWSVLE